MLPNFACSDSRSQWECWDQELGDCLYTSLLLDETKEAEPVQPARMVLNGDGTYSFQVFLCTIHSGIWKDTIDYTEINELLDTLLPRSGYRVCPGIQENMKPFVSFQSKHLHKCHSSFIEMLDIVEGKSESTFSSGDIFIRDRTVDISQSFGAGHTGITAFRAN